MPDMQGRHKRKPTAISFGIESGRKRWQDFAALHSNSSTQYFTLGGIVIQDQNKNRLGSGIALLALACVVSSPSNASTTSSIRDVIDQSSLDDLVSTSRPITESSSENEVESLLWKKYQKQVLSDVDSQNELNSKEIRYGDKVMKFSLEKRGSPGPNGYPLYIALHGGGSAPPSLNDSQWNHMKVYYRDSVDSGIYVATRGVTNTWDLHFVQESYPLYDHLISLLIATQGVDPNRVYLMGFSAGGDGVYQLVPRMADRWAAANMSAGHNNWIRFDNLFNVPFLMQMGSNDGAYKRNRNVVENYLEMNRLQKERGGYIHELNLHNRGSHNSWRDNDPTGRSQTVITNLAEWLGGAEAQTTEKNTNAVHWLKTFERKPLSEQLHWDYEIGAARDYVPGGKFLSVNNRALLTAPKNLFYWISVLDKKDADSSHVYAKLDSEHNQIRVTGLAHVSHFKLLLKKSMLDFSKPIQVTLGASQSFQVSVQSNIQTMTRTLLERGDPSYLFHSEIEFKQVNGVWSVISGGNLQ